MTGVTLETLQFSSGPMVLNEDNIMSYYRNGFIDQLGRLSSSDPMNKQAQVLRGFGQLLKGLGNIGRGTGSGIVKATKAIAEGFPFPDATTITRAHSSLAGSMHRGLLSHIPLLKSFGRGYGKAQRAYLSKLRPGDSGSALHTLLGLGKGSIMGNTLYGLGEFSKHHPYLGAMALTVPTAYLATQAAKSNDAKGIIDTMTPEQMNLFRRKTNRGGYSGLKSNDFDLFL